QWYIPEQAQTSSSLLWFESVPLLRLRSPFASDSDFHSSAECEWQRRKSECRSVSFTQQVLHGGKQRQMTVQPVVAGKIEFLIRSIEVAVWQQQRVAEIQI